MSCGVSVNLFVLRFRCLFFALDVSVVLFKIESGLVSLQSTIDEVAFVAFSGSSIISALIISSVSSKSRCAGSSDV